MSEEKTFVFPEGAGSGSSSVDPNVLLAMMNNGNSGFGGNNAIWIIFLLALFGRGGFGGFGNNGAGASELNSDYGTSLLMQGLNGNRTAISELATNLHVDTASIQTAVNSVQSAVQSVGNQVGMSGLQVINAIQSGNATLASQLSSCCCENRLATCQQTNTLTSRIDQLSSGMQAGFASTAYETQAQTNALQNTLKDTSTANTQAILAKLDQMENAAMQDKIATLTEKNSSLTTQLNLEHQNAAVAAMLAPIQAEVNAIKAAQPNTVAVQYPNLTAIPSAYLYGAYGTGVFTNGGWA